VFTSHARCPKAASTRKNIDWRFLAKYYANKGYTPVDEAIDPAKAKEAKQ
jgi:hypothetical protein